MTITKNYALGHAKHAMSSHEARTAEVDAAFLLPHIEPHFRILDVGCGPGTISAGLAKYVPQGQVVGIDISPKVLSRACQNAAALPNGSPPNLEFLCIDVLMDAEYNDQQRGDTSESPTALPAKWLNSFDVIYESNVLVHLPDPVRAIQNLKLCLRSDTGIFTTRDYDVHSSVYTLDPTGQLEQIGKLLGCMVSFDGGSPSMYGGRDVPSWLTHAGLPREKMLVEASSVVYGSLETTKWWGTSMAGRFEKGDAIRENMIQKHILTEDECDQLAGALHEWSRDPNGLYFCTAIQALVPVQG